MTATVSPQTEKKLKKFPKFDQMAIGQKIRSLAAGQIPFGQEKLAGFKDAYRVRVGDYRIVYRRFPDSIYIITIGHRKEVYDLLTRLVR